MYHDGVSPTSAGWPNRRRRRAACPRRPERGGGRAARCRPQASSRFRRQRWEARAPVRETRTPIRIERTACTASPALYAVFDHAIRASPGQAFRKPLPNTRSAARLAADGCRRPRRPRRPRAQPQGRHRLAAAERASSASPGSPAPASRSLAFDTIYAEGQRRYVESLSAYARQFLQMMEKPDVDSIDGLSPGDLDRPEDDARATRARRSAPSPRSTTTCACSTRASAGRTARSAAARSPGRRSSRSSTRSSRCPRARASPSTRRSCATARASTATCFEELRRDGFTRVKVDGEQRLLEEEIVLDKKFKHTIEVVVDRLVMKPDLRTRLAQSVETAAALADGPRRDRRSIDGERAARSPRSFACPEHGVSLPELQPRIFSFNSPHGACPRCTGLGAQQEIDPDLLVPDPTLSIGEGALVPWSVGSSSFYESVIQAIADRYEIDLDTPWQELTRGAAGPASSTAPTATASTSQYRNRMGRQRSYMLAFEGIVASLAAPLPRDRLVAAARADRGVHELPAVPGRARARGSSPRCSRSRSASSNIHEFTRMSVTRALAFLDELELTRDRAADRRAHRQGDPRAADVPRQRRRRLPRSSTARRRRSPAARRSGCGSRRRSARSSSACSTSSTSRRSACTSATTTS